MFSYRIEISTYDAARPYAVICNEKVLNPVKGRFATKAQAQAKIRRLTAPVPQATGDIVTEAPGYWGAFGMEGCPF